MSLIQLKEIIKNITKQNLSTKAGTIQISVPQFNQKTQVIVDKITQSYIKTSEKYNLDQKTTKAFFAQYSIVLLGLKLHIEKDSRWIQIVKMALKKINSILNENM